MTRSPPTTTPSRLPLAIACSAWLASAPSVKRSSISSDVYPLPTAIAVMLTPIRSPPACMSSMRTDASGSLVARKRSNLARLSAATTSSMDAENSLRSGRPTNSPNRRLAYRMAASRDTVTTLCGRRSMTARSGPSLPSSRTTRSASSPTTNPSICWAMIACRISSALSSRSRRRAISSSSLSCDSAATAQDLF
jgi:hypothetical protein